MPEDNDGFVMVAVPEAFSSGDLHIIILELSASSTSLSNDS